MFNGIRFNASRYNGNAVGPTVVSDSESTSTLTEADEIGLESPEALWLNTEGDSRGHRGTFNAFRFNAGRFNGGQRRRGQDWAIEALVSDAESTAAVSETESIIQEIVLDLSDPSQPSFLRQGSLRWGHKLNQRSWANFQAHYPGAVPTYYAPRVGHLFRLVDFDGTERFVGSIHNTRKRLVNVQGSKRLVIDCQCTGWEQIADRFLVTETYTSQTLGAIAADLVSTYLAGEGITATGLPTGPTLDKVVFSYPTRVSDAFDELSRLTGYWWRITGDKNLVFYSPATAVASPLTIDANGLNYRSLEVEEDRSQYRNKQFLGNVRTLTASLTDTFKGDGALRTFPCRYDLNQVPTVTLNGSPQTVGIRDVDTGKDWYWSKGSPELVQDSAGTLLTSSDTLSVTFVGEYMQVRAVTDSDEVTDRAGIEGGTGVYEWYTDDGVGLSTAGAADDFAQSLIDRNAPIPSKVRIQTDHAGNTLPGQYVPITEPALALDGDFFVSEVEFEVLPGTEVVRASVQASSNEPEAAWQAAWKTKRQQSDLSQVPTSGV